jgi:GNAT superfamily N-acetyltransferase
MNNPRTESSTTHFILRQARLDETDLLTDLSLRSKSYWGYDADFMAKCVPLLQVTPEMITQPGWRCMVAQSDSRVLGYSLLQHPVDFAEAAALLESLFIDPAAIGKGMGQALLKDALAAARDKGCRFAFVEADPNAEAFYLKYGAVRISQRESSIEAGRTLPWLRFTLNF